MDERKPEKRIRIWVMTHKPVMVSLPSVYVPLQVGKALHEDLGYTGDDTGDNISALNIYYGELTGQYWAAKQKMDMDYTGLCHYRRYFLNQENHIMEGSEYLDQLQHHDVILPRAISFPKSYYEVYQESHNIHDLDAVGDAIRTMNPQLYEVFSEVVNGHEVHSSNMFVASSELFREYTDWLFSVFEMAKENINPEAYDAYHRRVYGFLSEQLNFVWIRWKGLGYCEVPCGITQEKAETMEVKEMLKREISKGDAQCGIRALDLFRAQIEKRPDIMLPASDLRGEMEDLFRVIYILAREQENKRENCMLWLSSRLDDLLCHYRLIRTIRKKMQSGTATQEEMQYYRDAKVSSDMEEQIDQMGVQIG